MRRFLLLLLTLAVCLSLSTCAETGRDPGTADDSPLPLDSSVLREDFTNASPRAMRHWECEKVGGKRYLVCIGPVGERHFAAPLSAVSSYSGFYGETAYFTDRSGTITFVSPAGVRFTSLSRGFDRVCASGEVAGHGFFCVGTARGGSYLYRILGEQGTVVRSVRSASPCRVAFSDGAFRFDPADSVGFAVLPEAGIALRLHDTK